MLLQQAWQLLTYEHPEMQISIMASHIGNWQTDGPWTSQKIVSGAYREDEEDLVYGHSLALVTINHFWDADSGDNSKKYFFPNYMHNAYQKAKVFIYGSDDEGNRRIIVNESGWWPEFTPFHTTAWYFSYDSLFDLYKTGKYYWEGYVDDAGDPHFSRQGPFYMSYESRDKYVWEILGRVAHLLTDMGVPAHAHNDSHWPDTDDYEETMTTSYAQNWDYSNAYSQGGVINVNNKYDPLRYLFYTTNQIADFFPSNGDISNLAPGDDDYNPNYGSDYYAELDNILTNLGSPPSSINIPNIANTSFVTSIRTVAGLLYWFANETGIIPLPPTIFPTSKNVGTVKGTSIIMGSFTIINNGAGPIHGNVTTTNPYYDLDYINTPYTYEDIIYFTIPGGESFTINYKGIAPAYYGPFTEVFSITTNIGYNSTYTIIGDIALPDYCYGETDAMAASPEEQLFDKAFIDYFAVNNKSLDNDRSKSIKERLSFAYKLLKQPETESVDKICKMIIDLYPESEMGISFYAMGLLWEASLSKEAPEFGEKEFKSYLKELTERKDKYKINGYAQLISSLLDVGNDIKGLERLFTDYKYDVLKELALFHQFIHYYVYKQDKERAREISDKLDKMFVDSKYGYQAHLIFGDEGYSLEGMKKLMDEKKADLLAKSLAKSRDNQAEILSEMPTEYKLFNNYPNPFNPTTTIKYSVPKVSNVKLSIYNMMGQLIKTLVNETKAPGFYNAEWNGTNESNFQVSSGIYFYRFESDNFISNKKMILLR